MPSSQQSFFFSNIFTCEEHGLHWPRHKDDRRIVLFFDYSLYLCKCNHWLCWRQEGERLHVFQLRCLAGKCTDYHRKTEVHTFKRALRAIRPRKKKLFLVLSNIVERRKACFFSFRSAKRERESCSGLTLPTACLESVVIQDGTFLYRCSW